MAKKKAKSKSNFLGFRLPEKTLSQLDLIANQVGKTRGLVAKDAIKRWLDLETFNQTNEMIMISKSMFIKLLSSIEKNTLKNLSEEIAILIANIMRFIISSPMSNGSLNKYTKFMIKLFGRTGLKWFNTIDIKVQNNHLVFSGLHDLGEDFSSFFADFYKYIVINYFELEFETNFEEKTSNLIHIDYTIKNIE